uniref:Discs, large homolog 4b (Drosophila) n=1 Tax=Paramormyrops kingsleyae TaxID=1676925 RepID=A0A3B3QF91_9TELE
TEQALRAMQACQSAGDEAFRVQAQKLLHIFQSDLFQALLIQEYYELTVFENREPGRPLTP